MLHDHILIYVGLTQQGLLNIWGIQLSYGLTRTKNSLGVRYNRSCTPKLQQFLRVGSSGTKNQFLLHLSLHLLRSTSFLFIGSFLSFILLAMICRSFHYHSSFMTNFFTSLISIQIDSISLKPHSSSFHTSS
jgi:hypothetical protein